MSFLFIFFMVFSIIIGFFFFLWLISLWLKNASIVDIFWGFGFVLAAWLYFAYTPDGYNVRKWILVTLVTIWGLRLSVHILLRNFGKEEDYRYQNWRNEHGKNWWWISFFQVFLLQAALCSIISIPLLAAQFFPSPAYLTILDYAGIIIWLIGFIFEAGGDYQLAIFKKDPQNKGKLLTSGLWRFSRHPNYFGDAAQWWGFSLFAFSVNQWWVLISPILMTYLLLRVSGVALLEKSLAKSIEGYEEYIQSTPAFFPWLPKSKK